MASTAPQPVKPPLRQILAQSWFFFRLAENVAAWEASTGSGRATYFFRMAPAFETAAAALTRGLALVNFRREPVYLPEDSLAAQPRYHRYLIGCRKLPALRALRVAYLGRAIHSDLEAWSAQVAALLGGVKTAEI